CTRLEEHTVSVLTALKNAGVTPKWVQVGNETNAGMLFGHWDQASKNYINDGGLDLTDLNKHFAEYAQLVTSGSRAVKSVFPESLVIVHLANGYDNGLYRWNIGGLIAKDAEFDVIGMSLYPPKNDWPNYNKKCIDNINDLVSRYNKPVMICEVGMDYTAASTCKWFLIDLIKRVNLISSGKGLGVFYWEPQCYGDWPIGDPYRMGAWGSNGRPTEAMDAFLIK
ncbi:MAG TPA: glycosyl hydrolase 53 family protein, partial [Bacillota bacterium]|nr:glycosyl hydrolase 53 family protein [Bacillota bacterium]